MVDEVKYVDASGEAGVRKSLGWRASIALASIKITSYIKQYLFGCLDNKYTHVLDFFDTVHDANGADHAGESNPDPRSPSNALSNA